MSNQIEYKRLDWIDVTRSLACLCVIVMHAPIDGGLGGEWFLAPRLFFARSLFICFFLVSGALSLAKPLQPFKFIKSRIIRIVVPTVIWTVVSLLLYALSKDITWKEFFVKTALIPAGPQVRIYWFNYVLFGIYLLMPIFAAFLKQSAKRELELYLVIYGIALMVPYLTVFFPYIQVVTEIENGWLYYFSGFLWLALLGYYIRMYVEIAKLKWWHIAIYILLFISPLFIFYSPLPNHLVQNNLSINVILLSACHFILLKHINYSEKVKRIAYLFSKYSFGIYLVHILVKRYIVAPIIEPLHLNYLVQVPIVVVLITIISYMVVHILSKLPFSKYTVGM